MAELELSNVRKRYETEMNHGRRQHQMTTIKLQTEVGKLYWQAHMAATMLGEDPEHDPTVRAFRRVIDLISSDDWLIIGEMAMGFADLFDQPAEVHALDVPQPMSAAS